MKFEQYMIVFEQSLTIFLKVRQNDPILLFSQITITIIVGFTTVENIQLREQLNIGAKRKKYRRRTKIRQM